MMSMNMSVTPSCVRARLLAAGELTAALRLPPSRTIYSST